MNGDHYRGQFHNGVPEGHGELSRVDGTVLRGRWHGSSLISSDEKESPIMELQREKFQGTKPIRTASSILQSETEESSGDSTCEMDGVSEMSKAEMARR